MSQLRTSSGFAFDAEVACTVSVIMPVLNESADLGMLLDSILAQVPPVGGFEVIVADGGSTDGTQGLVGERQASHQNLILVHNPGRKSSAGRNAGARVARGKYLVFIDGHCRVGRSDYLQRIVELFRETGADCLCRPQPLEAFDEAPWALAIAEARRSALGHNPGSDIFRSKAGFTDPRSAGAAYTRACFAAVGGYDEGFDACEDVELNVRVAKRGYRSYLHPDLSISYRVRPSPKRLFGQMRRYGRGRAALARKHPGETPWLLVAMALGLIGTGAAAMIDPALGAALAGAGSVGYGVTVGVVAGRMAEVERRKVAAALVLVHLGLLAGFLEGAIPRNRPGHPRQQSPGRVRAASPPPEAGYGAASHGPMPKMVDGGTGVPKDLPLNWSDRFAGQDVVVISPQHWGGMWVSKHWIAWELSRFNRVLFVEPPTWVAGMLRGKTCLSLREWCRAVRPLRRIKQGLHVLAPRLLPPILPRSKRDESIRVARGVASAVSHLGMDQFILLNFGTNYHLMDLQGAAMKVYYCVDPPFPPPGKEHFEQWTCEKASVVLAVSEDYRRRLASLVRAATIRVVPHGFPWKHASAILADQAIGRPQELQGLHGPIVGYTGSIHDAYVDIDLLEYLAAQRPSYSFVLIGPYRKNPIGPSISEQSLLRLRRLRNVHLLGPRHFKELPRYVKFFDVCLILHEVSKFADSAATTTRTPFKLLQYLSQGKPVVTPPLAELRPIERLVHVATNKAEYLVQVDTALKEPSSHQQERIAYAQQFDFDTILTLLVDSFFSAQGK